jgi:hypothetical protein
LKGILTRRAAHLGAAVNCAPPSTGRATTPIGGRSSRGQRATRCCWATPLTQPTKRESITCEINLPRTGADRKVAGIIAADERGALYLAIPAAWAARGRPAQVGLPRILADGVWRTLAWPDGEETEALVVAPLDSPRLTRLLGQFVDAVRRFKAGEPPTARTGLCVEPAIVDSARRRATGGWSTWPCTRSSPSAACSAADDLFSLRGERPQPLFALVADGGPRSSPWPWARCRSPRRAAAGRAADPGGAGALADPDSDALQALPFAFVRFRWRGARAVFDGLDDALE